MNGIPTFQGQGAQRLKRSVSRIVVTGASGWLGTATLEMLLSLLGPEFADRVVCFGSSGKQFRLRANATVRQHPLTDIQLLDRRPTLMLNLAFLTREKSSAMPLEDYIAANRAISSRTLEALGPIGTEAVFIPSSGAVYSAMSEDADVSANPYGKLKLEDEQAFARWALDHGASAVIARVFNLSGPYMTKRSTYALSSFIVDALQERPISIQARKRVYRSYSAIEELMSVVAFLLTGEDPKVSLFDTAGDEVVEMGEIAERVLKVLRRPRTIERPPLDPAAAEDRYVGDGTRYFFLREEAGVPAIDFDRQILQTARFIAEDMGIRIRS